MKSDNSPLLYKKMKVIVWIKYGAPDGLQLKEDKFPKLIAMSKPGKKQEM